jgi:deoxyribonuclease V
VSLRAGTIVGESVVRGRTGAGYRAGLLALREGPLLERAALALPGRPDAVLVNATGRDHPRRAGLALHLGAVLGVPTVGVTDRPLLAAGAEPGAERWSMADLTLEGDVVAVRLRTRGGARALVVHAGWRTDLSVAVDLVRRSTARARTPEPLRAARRLARLARAGRAG